MKYTPRVVIRQDSPVTFPSHTFSDGSKYNFPTYFPPEINPLEDRVFPAPKTKRWKIQPPYNKSFKKVLRDRNIKMTPYSVGEISEKWHLATVSRTATLLPIAGVSRCIEKNKVKSEQSNIPGVVVMKTVYDDNYDIGRATDSFPSVEYSDTPTEEDIRSALNDLKSKVVSESYSGFDALTELGELPETLGLLRDLFFLALRPLQGIKKLRERYERARARGKSHKQAHSDIASEWMQYRYGIMPLVYSIQDLIKLLDQAFAEFKTDKSFTVLTSKPKAVPSTETHVAIYRAHEVRVSCVAKAKYSTPSNRLSDLITTNLFVTAWELIPLSFVIDWFVNVGDVIQSHTVGFADLSEERQFCYSIKRTSIDRYVLNYKFAQGAFRNYVWTPNPCFSKGPTPGYPMVYDNRTDVIGSKLLYERREQSYNRDLFSPNDVTLEFGPDLNWMRMLDGYVLSFDKISKLLKKLR